MKGWRTHPAAPWTGLFAGAAAWAVHHQLGADANMWSCTRANGAFAIATGLICLALAGAGGLVSWQSTTNDPASQYHRFARAVGLMAAALFILALLFQTLAGAIVPACLR
jgi:hypothetical protein